MSLPPMIRLQQVTNLREILLRFRGSCVAISCAVGTQRGVNTRASIVETAMDIGMSFPFRIWKTVKRGGGYIFRITSSVQRFFFLGEM